MNAARSREMRRHEPRQLAQHVEQPHDGERLGGLPHLATGGAHLRPRDAEELRFGLAPAQRLDEACAQRISRRLPRDQCHPQRTRHDAYRTRLRELE